MCAKILIFHQFSITLQQKKTIMPKSFSNMKRKLFMLATLAVVAFSMMLTSCNDDPEMSAVPPAFSDVVMDPARPQKGEKVNCTVKFKEKGKDWYKVNYSWTLYEQFWNNETNQYSYKAITGSNESSSLDMNEPQFSFEVPDTIKKSTFYRLEVNIKNVSASTLFPPSGAIYSSATIDNRIVTFTVQP